MDKNIQVEGITAQVDELYKECQQTTGNYIEYKQQVKTILKLRNKCVSDVKHRRYRLKLLNEAILNLKMTDTSNRENLHILKDKLECIAKETDGYEEMLPKENSLYLKIVLGDLNLSMMDKESRFSYKQNYERFKFIVSSGVFLLVFIICLTGCNKTLDSVYQFILLWYYCTLTIRESILRINGSRIKGWWVAHHFMSTIGAGILLIWPTSYAYMEFHSTFKWFAMYISLTHIAQYYYQNGSLYRLKSLGMTHDMHITVEGFQSWMWRGLSFLLPFLVLGYIYHSFITYKLYHLYTTQNKMEWQLVALFLVFAITLFGNVITLFIVLKAKLPLLVKNRITEFAKKYIS